MTIGELGNTIINMNIGDALWWMTYALLIYVGISFAIIFVAYLIGAIIKSWLLKRKHKE